MNEKQTWLELGKECGSAIGLILLGGVTVILGYGVIDNADQEGRELGRDVGGGIAIYMLIGAGMLIAGVLQALVLLLRAFIAILNSIWAGWNWMWRGKK